MYYLLLIQMKIITIYNDQNNTNISRCHNKLHFQNILSATLPKNSAAQNNALHHQKNKTKR